MSSSTQLERHSCQASGVIIATPQLTQILAGYTRATNQAVYLLQESRAIRLACLGVGEGLAQAALARVVLMATSVGNALLGFVLGLKAAVILILSF